MLLPPGYQNSVASKLSIDEKYLQHVKSEKFICNKLKIMELIKICGVPNCNQKIEKTKSKKVGYSLELEWYCPKGHFSQWSSCDKINGIYANNLLTAGSILLTGNQFAKFSLQCDSINLAHISETSFNDYQDKYLFPVVECCWKEMKDIIHESLRGDAVVAAGDGQMDSPGHSAKYCIYTIMDEDSHHILDQDVVDVRETNGKSSVWRKLVAREP